MVERGGEGPAPGCWPWRFAAVGVPVCAAAPPERPARVFSAAVLAVSESFVASVISGDSGVRSRRCWVPGSAVPSSSSWGGVNESDIVIVVYLWF